MFGMFKKGGKSDKHRAVTPEGEKISKPISGNIQGTLREALEKIAYVLENNLNEEQHVVTFVATVDESKASSEESGLQNMDCAFVRASDESIGDILMQVGMRDDTFAKAMIAVGQAIQFHKPEMKEYAKELKAEVQRGQRAGEIPKKSDYTGGPSSLRTGKKRGLNFESFKDGMKGVNIDDLSNASDDEIDDLIDGLMGGDDD